MKVFMTDELDLVKSEHWFYEFNLPDGSKTKSYLPESARMVHVTREKALRQFLMSKSYKDSTALDISCHEGFFTLLLSEYFSQVIGVDKNGNSIQKAKRISSIYGNNSVEFVETSVEAWLSPIQADFVLCFGLLYHVENPIQIIRTIAGLTKSMLCIESQILPLELNGYVEDGNYMWQRELKGSFGICKDYSHAPEGGLTNIALVPSKTALEFLLREFGFSSIKYYLPEDGDYEQFIRGQRVIIYAEK
jgi:SAM-dependent methyltransferase